jgi:hypothetical protein
MFVFWGWNRAMFSKSDIHFKGNGYDFVLHNVVAHDRPSDLSWDYINPGEVSNRNSISDLVILLKIIWLSLLHKTT